jgi:hypothetical protein
MVKYANLFKNVYPSIIFAFGYDERILIHGYIGGSIISISAFHTVSYLCVL